MSLDTVQSAIDAFRNGELIIVVDDDDRENEGDLILAASKATPETLALMIRHTSGIICAPMDAQRADRLNLAPMVANNLDPMRTAFTVSVDYLHGMTTGISATERANTLSALANDNSQGADFTRPGHIFPLIGKPGGVLTRSGHTEAAIDLANLAGLPQVGVLAEIVNDDGSVKRLPELLEFAKEHNLKIISIEDMIEYRLRTESFVTCLNNFPSGHIPLENTTYIYSTPFDAMQHIALVYGDIREGCDIPCRIHLEKPLTDIFDVQTGQNQWLKNALEKFSQHGKGVLIFLRDPTIVTSDFSSFSEQEGEFETHESARSRNRRWREIGLGAQILRDLGITSISLIASQEMDYVGLSGFGIEITETELVER